MGVDAGFDRAADVRGRAEVFKEFVSYLDSRISIAVLGQTLTTEQGDRGSQALGNVHQTVREDIEESDARQLAGVLRRDFVIPVVALNHGMRKTYPRVVIQRKKSADAKLLGEVLEKLVPMGLRVRADQVRSVLHLDAPADGDEVLEPPMSTSPRRGGRVAAPRPARNGGRAGAAPRHRAGGRRDRGRRVADAGGAHHRADPGARGERSGGAVGRSVVGLPGPEGGRTDRAPGASAVRGRFLGTADRRE